MASQQILRLRRTDNDQATSLLLSVKPRGIGSVRNIKLVALDRTAENLYHGNVKDANIKTLQANSFSGDLEQWQAILSFALLHERADGLLPEHLQGLELVASISGEKATITIRKTISGISQKLGSVELQQDNAREEVDVVEWTDIAVATSDSLRDQLQTLQTSSRAQQEQVTHLTAQLEQLVTAKKEHEDELLSKFAALLNAKKLKIRDQQRLLVGAKIDPKTAEAVASARNGASSSSRRAGDSRGGKRKADGSVEVEDEGLSDEDGLDADEDAEEPQVTPEASDDETEDEDAGPAFAQSSTAPSKATGKDRDGIEVDEEPPPFRRELPISRKAAIKATTPPVSTRPTNDIDDDDETDDEL